MREQSASAEYRDTAAARMLAAGLSAAAEERGLSQRTIAKQLGYKQSVVLSHMALGRVPIPIERVAQLAEVLQLDCQAFLAAALEQRYPEYDWSPMSRASTSPSGSSDLVSDLEVLGGGPVDGFSPRQKMVMREVAADRNADLRWMSVHEVSAMLLLRKLRPDIAIQGLSMEDREAITRVLSNDEQGDDSDKRAIF